MTKTTIIQHPEYGRVEGVTFKKIELSDPKAWTAVHGDRFVEGWISQDKGCFYLKSGGWSEVLAKRDVTGDISNICDIKYHFSSDSVNFYEFSFTMNKSDKRVAPKLEGRKAQAVVLPEGMSWEEWLRKYYMLSQFSLKELLSTHTTTVIQVLKEGD